MWPNGATSSYSGKFRLRCEEVSIREDPENANRPGTLSPGSTAQGGGPAASLTLLDRLSLPRDFLVPDASPSAYPTRCETSAPPRVGHYGYTRASPSHLAPP